MKKSAFTMVELIFVIVIIGILAAVALPQFRNVARNAKVSNFTKIIGDIKSGAVSAYVNEKHLNKMSNILLSDILDIDGNDWNTSSDTNSTADGTTAYEYSDAIDEVYALITLNNGDGNTTGMNEANLTVEIVLGDTPVAKEISQKMGLDPDGNSTKTVIYDLE